MGLKLEKELKESLSLWKSILINDKQNVKRDSDNVTFRKVLVESLSNVNELKYVLKLIKNDRKK